MRSHSRFMLSITASNYEEAITLLKDRFRNKQKIINKHMKGLLNKAPVTSKNDLKGLRKIFDLEEAHVRGLKVLGASSECYGNLYCRSSVLLNKIRQEIRLIVRREIKGETRSQSPLLKELHRELEAGKNPQEHQIFRGHLRIHPEPQHSAPAYDGNL